MKKLTNPLTLGLMKYHLRIDRIYYSKDLEEKFDFKYNNLLVNTFSDH